MQLCRSSWQAHPERHGYFPTLWHKGLTGTAQLEFKNIQIDSHEPNGTHDWLVIERELLLRGLSARLLEQWAMLAKTEPTVPALPATESQTGIELGEVIQSQTKLLRQLPMCAEIMNMAVGLNDLAARADGNGLGPMQAVRHGVAKTTEYHRQLEEAARIFDTAFEREGVQVADPDQIADLSQAVNMQPINPISPADPINPTTPHQHPPTPPTPPHNPRPS